MKRKLLKTKLHHYIKIMVILFVVCFIISGAYSVITYNITLNNLRENASYNAGEFYNAVNDYGFAYGGYLFNASDNNIELKITDYSGKTVFKTGEYIVVDFNSAKNYFLSNIILLEQFNKSMTDSQYKKIKAYLKSKPDKSLYNSNAEPRYELSCREFYIDKFGFIIPKLVEIVITDDTNTWYAEDKVAESFSLNVKKQKGSKLYKSGIMNRNVIPADCITGKKQELEFLDYAIANAKNSDDSIPEQKLDIFTYVYYSHSNVYLSNSDYGYDIYKVYFAQRYNVLDYCSKEILIVFGVLLAFFIGIGFVLGYVTWKTVNTQIQEDEKRINMSNAMAHDLKTPLFIISGYAENLKESIDKDKQEYYADVILNQTDKMDRIIHNMLDLSKLDSFDFEIHKEKFYLNDIVKDIIKNYPEGRLIFSDLCLLEVNADKELMATALHNLIDNSLKYGVDEIPVKIKISNKRVEISNSVLKDIAKADLEKIWQPYTKLDPSRNTKGNGLGLAETKRIFHLHKYNFGVDCNNGIIIFWFEPK